MSALEDVVSGLHILQTAIGAAADDHLIDPDVLSLAGGVGVLRQMGVADRGLQLVQVDLDGLFVFGIRVGLVVDRGALAAAVQVRSGDLVHREDAVLGTGLNGHVADAEAILHGQGSHARAGEFHRLVQRPVHTDHADDVQDQVLAGYAGAELSLEHKLDGRGHLEPCHAGGHTADRKTATRLLISVVTGGHDAFFGQEGVLNTHLTHIVEVEDIILVGKLAALLGLGCALDVLIGDEVIQHDGNVLLVEHAVKARLLKLVDGDRGGDIVAQHDIEPGIDELACLDLRQTRMCGQNFLRQSHSHNTLSFYFPWSRCPSYNLSVSHSLDSSPSRGALGIA